MPVDALGEEGKAPSVPGPLLRAPVGTLVRGSIRNALPETLVVTGLSERGPGTTQAKLHIAPGETRSLAFTISAPGAYVYYSDLIAGKDTIPGGHGTHLVGAIIGDTAGAPPERVMTMTFWNRLVDSTARRPSERVLFLWNGKLWPHTPRLEYTVGDTVRWRVIDMSFDEHPIHLHGFYFRVDSRGSFEKDTAYTPDQRRIAVTESTPPFGNFTITWVPERAGNWIVHCHKPAHTFWGLRYTLANRDVPDAPMPVMPDEHGTTHVQSGMSGLVVAVTVRPRAGDIAQQATQPLRRVRVLAQQHDGFYGERPGFGYVIQQGSTAPAPDSIRIPGAPIVLTRGVPAAVTVVNRLTVPTAVHWHGIELESFYDGVVGWSGAGTRVAPMIAPNDSFVARFTPKRAGTFMYHTHQDDAWQMERGLYAPLIVLEPGVTWNPAVDHVLMIGAAFQGKEYVVALNGSTTPPALQLRPGVSHRFRVINVTVDEAADVSWYASADSTDSTLVSWRAIAKDGADLPLHQATMRPARLHLTPGEIYDFEATPGPGDGRIVVRSSNTSTLSVRVRE